MKRNEVDLLVCPEMALTGYMFTSAQDIIPYLEYPRIGPTSLFCRELATTYGCWVVAGYPELAEESETDTGAGQQEDGKGTIKEGSGGDDVKPGYNSAVLVSPSGEVVGNYRKSFLYDTDKTWAREGKHSLSRHRSLHL
jgi:protein N-terminal amidase